jgi:cytochrome b6-f complex iron-sulfur subunit
MTTTKDESALPETAAAAEASRRRVLRWLWWGLGLAAAGELAWIGLSFVRPRRSAADAEDALIFVAGAVEDFSPGTVTAFPAGSFYLARLESGGFLALDRTCTHLGCTVPWNAGTGRFECPCHASSFDITGAVLGPPAPRPLDRYPVRIENGVVKIDLRNKLRRAAFDASQAVSS